MHGVAGDVWSAWKSMESVECAKCLDLPADIWFINDEPSYLMGLVGQFCMLWMHRVSGGVWNAWNPLDLSDSMDSKHSRHLHTDHASTADHSMQNSSGNPVR